MNKKKQLDKNMTFVTNTLIQIIKDNETQTQTKINACETLINISVQFDKIKDDEFSFLDTL